MSYRVVPEGTPGALRFTEMDAAQNERLTRYLHSLLAPGRDAERREIMLAIFRSNAPMVTFE